VLPLSGSIPLTSLGEPFIIRSVIQLWRAADCAHSSRGMAVRMQTSNRENGAMMKRIGLIGILVLLWAAGLNAETPDVGSFKTVKGSVILESAAGQSAAAVGMQIHPNDTVITGADGAAGILFNDDTRLSLGPNTRIVVDSYVFSPAEGKFSMITRLARGTAEYISGKLGELAPEAVEV
jgi:hypothetical protein